MSIKPLDDIVAAGVKALPPDGKVINLDFKGTRDWLFNSGLNNLLPGRMILKDTNY